MGKTAALDGIAAMLDQEDADAYLRIDSSEDPDLYYLTGFDVPDPVTYLHTGEETVLLLNDLEYSRAKTEADVDRVEREAAYRRGSHADTLASFLEDYGIEDLLVPRDFSLATAQQLEQRGYSVEPVDDSPVTAARGVKTDDEIQAIRETQQHTEDAMAVVETMLEESSEDEDGTLYHAGEALTAERLRGAVETYLVQNNCYPEKTIVAPGERSADPHWRGEGTLKAGEPVIVDIFPRDQDSNYFGDMTRTFVAGEPDEKLEAMYEATKEAQDAAFQVLEQGAGVTGEEVHEAVLEHYEEQGFDTFRTSDGGSGFIHSTGHPVGLEVHDAGTGLAIGEGELEAGEVVTVEPGLYNPDIGGVRIEDMVVVTENGYENLNSYERTLQPGTEDPDTLLDRLLERLPV